MPDILFITNPISGTSKKSKIISDISDIVNAGGLSSEVRLTEYKGHAKEIAQKAISEGIKKIVAVGGDGTVNEVASALVGTDVALGIIPCGSGNGLARHLKIPMNHKKAMKVIIDGIVDRIDVCTIGDRYFFCTFGLGFDAEVAKHFAERGKRGILNYIKSAVFVNRHYVPQRYEISSPDFKLNEVYQVIAVGNASQYGNNAFIAPFASLRDGKIDVVLIKPSPLLSRFEMASRMFLKRLKPGKRISMFKTDSVTLHPVNGEIFNAHADGEALSLSGTIDINCRPLSLTVLLPKELKSF